MKIAITGATGFLGRHLTEHLLANGNTVRILARDADKAKDLADRVDAVVVGDVADRPVLDELVRDCHVVFHLVSNFRTAKDPPEMHRRTNVEGTKVALAAARAANVNRFIHCSTIGVHGHVQNTPATEDSPYAPGDLYQNTKAEAEQHCRSEMAKPGIEIVVVRPCSIYGPGDFRMLKMFRMLAKGRFFTLGRCEENFHAVYIDDLVDGFTKAMVTPRIGGEIFLIGGPEYVSLKDYLATAAAAVGAPPPKIHLPYGPVLAVSKVLEAVCVPLGLEPPLHPRRVRFFKNNRAFSIDKARRMLDYVPRIGLEEGMKRTVAWYREHGHL